MSFVNLSQGLSLNKIWWLNTETLEMKNTTNKSNPFPKKPCFLLFLATSFRGFFIRTINMKTKYQKALTGSSLINHCRFEAGCDLPDVQFKLNVSPIWYWNCWPRMWGPSRGRSEREEFCLNLVNYFWFSFKFGTKEVIHT